MKLDWTINVGTIIHMVGMLVAGFMAYSRVIERIKAVEVKNDILMSWFSSAILEGRSR